MFWLPIPSTDYHCSKEKLICFHRVDDGNWHHVALVIDTDTSEVGWLIVDGIKCASLTLTFRDLAVTPSLSLTSISVGGYMYESVPYVIPVAGATGIVTMHTVIGDPFWHGCMDEFRVWSVARSIDQIWETMFSVFPAFNTSSPGLEGVWTFDKNNDAIFKSPDSSPNGRDAIAGDGLKFSVSPSFVPTQIPMNQSELSEYRGWRTTAWERFFPSPEASLEPTNIISAPSPRHSAALSVRERTLFLFGGAAMNASRLVLSNEVWMFDLDHREWTLLQSSLAHPTAGLTALSKNNMILLLGGIIASSTNNYFQLSNLNLVTMRIEEQTSAENLLTQAFGLSLPFSYHTFHHFDNALFVFGGMNGDVLSSTLFTLHVDDISEPFLTILEGTAPLMSSRSLSMMQSDSSGRFFFNIGGLESFADKNVVPDSTAVFAMVNPWKFDEAETRWSWLPAPEDVLGIAGHTLAYFDKSNELLVHGGYRLQVNFLFFCWYKSFFWICRG